MYDFCVGAGFLLHTNTVVRCDQTSFVYTEPKLPYRFKRTFSMKCWGAKGNVPQQSDTKSFSKRLLLLFPCGKTFEFHQEVEYIKSRRMLLIRTYSAYKLKPARQSFAGCETNGDLDSHLQLVVQYNCRRINSRRLS